MKGRVQGLLIIIVLLVSLCPSFCISAYASDYYDSELYDYNDSYVMDEDNLDCSLIFFPLIPDSSVENYMIFSSGDNYYLYVADSFVTWFDIYANKLIVNTSEFTIYQYKSNNWNYYGSSSEHDFSYYNFNELCVIDSTLPVDNHYGDDYYKYTSSVQKNGYRIYWQLTLVLMQVIDNVNKAADLILSIDLLKYAVLPLLAAEILIFVVILIKRLGDLKNEE